MTRQRAAPGAAHLLVDVAVVDAVEHRRRPGRQRAADHGRGDQPELRDAAGGEEHHRHGREQQQLDHAGLGEADVRRQHVAHARPVARHTDVCGPDARGRLGDVGHGCPRGIGCGLVTRSGCESNAARRIGSAAKPRRRKEARERCTRAGVDRAGRQGRGHRPGAGHGRRAEGRQRASRHRDEPRAGGVPAVPEGDAARPVGPGLDRPRPVRAVVRALVADPLPAAVPRRVRDSSSTTSRRCGRGAARPPATRSTATPPASRSPPVRSARASATRSAWRWPLAGCAACSTPRRRPAPRRSTTGSTSSRATATSRRA